MTKTRSIRDVALALQAGGSSIRMGEDKAFLKFGGVSLLEWIRDRVAPSFRHTFVVTNEPSRYRSLGLPVVADAAGERGAAVGIYSAVLASPAPRVLCLACDLPFVTPHILRHLALGSRDLDVYVPRQGPYLQPLCAVYGRETAPHLEELLSRGERRIYSVYPKVRTGYLDVDDGRFGDPDILFLNLNTPSDVEKAGEILEMGGDPLTTGAAGRSASLVGRSRLSSRIRAFEAETPVPVVSFVGKKKSGKTTVLVGVIQELVRRGVRPGVVKHDVHGFDVDVPGTDSYRLRRAGAVATGISSPEKYVWINEVGREPSLRELVDRITEPIDVLLTEGFKRQDAAKVEVSRRERSTELMCSPDEMIGVASDQSFPGLSVPMFDLDDFSGLASLVSDYAGLLHGPVNGPVSEPAAGPMEGKEGRR